MAFTQAELDAAVEKLVRTTIRREYGALGNRRLDQAFGDVQDAAAGVFIAQQNAPFYVVFLAAQRLQDAVDAEVGLASDLLSAILATDRRVRPVEQLSPLVNARVALDALAGASEARSQGFRDILDVPAFRQFESGTDRFLKTVSAGLVDGGDIVHTPSEARKQLARLYSQFVDSRAGLQRRVQLLVDAISDFSGLNLAATVGSSVIEKARASLASRISELEALSASERLSIIREVTLDILAARAAVRGFGSLSRPGIFLALSGVGQVFADSTRPAAPAVVTSDVYGPYPLLPDALELDITLDGDAAVTTTVQLQGSFVAFVGSTISESYDIGAPNTAGVTNNELRLQLGNYPSVGSVTTVDVPLSTGAAQSVFEVVAEVNAAVTTASGAVRIPLTAEPASPVPKIEVAVDTNLTTSTSDATFTAVNPSVDFTVLGVVEGDVVIITDPTSPNARLYFTVDAGGLSATSLVCSLGSGAMSPTSVDEAGVQVSVGSGVSPRLRVSNLADTQLLSQPTPPFIDFRAAALGAQLQINIPLDGATSQDVQFDAATTLGLFPGTSYISRAVSALDAAAIFNASSQSAVLGQPRVEAEAVFDPIFYAGPGRTSPVDFLRVVASKFQGTASLVATPTEVTLSLGGAAAAGVEVGDVLAIRGSAVTADIGLFGSVTAVSDTSVTAGVVGATTAASVDFEVGPDLSGVGFDATARLSDFGGNELDYRILEVGPVPFELRLDAALPFPGTTPGNLPVEGVLEVGRFLVRFSSLEEGLATAITIDDGGGNPRSASSLFFSGGGGSAVGSTPYFQLPSIPSSLEEGDQLEVYTVQFNSPSTTARVVAVQASSRVVQLDEALPTSTPAYTFGVDVPVPFARVRKMRRDTYEVFRADLQAWLTDATNRSVFSAELSRVLNPLTSSQNPTLAEVNEAKGKVAEVSASLVELTEAIDGYQVEPVDAVDTLIAALIQEGADRAVDTLLEARFSDFFGFDQNDVSYAGSVEKALREVARTDLPVRKDARVGDNAGRSQTIAEYEEPDFEYDTSDLDDTPEPDIPIGSDFDFPGRGY